MHEAVFIISRFSSSLRSLKNIYKNLLNCICEAAGKYAISNSGSSRINIL
jgi:hypothetical protein